ncbi:PEP-CTERM protein-sorting domain-containing protein [Verrucomicrobium sp. GAS474]|uniref:PEP-CTERM sorting domain-containing protein n=1 Tax=Verrucomicrobium sp. GAS474 TaxID=1882831 RepID=UPI00087D2380|nr:PEP-CTERM sorting domain-containing protein [Verrucomicrobium sp. GAS474]SDU27483.1 PEP-CTERM protein-sorting domain-containing protein [Verrucomicrobium sp. GAS474]
MKQANLGIAARVLVALVLMFGTRAFSADVYYYNGAGTTNVLHGLADWVNGSASAPADTATLGSSGNSLVFSDNSSYLAAGSPTNLSISTEASLTYGNIVDNLAENLTLSLSSGASISIKATPNTFYSAYGSTAYYMIDMSQAGGNLEFAMGTGASYKLIAATAAITQTWNVATGRTLTFDSGTISTSGTTQGTLVLTGGGNIVLNANITTGSNWGWTVQGANVTMAGANVYTRSTSISSGALTLSGSIASSFINVTGGTFRGTGTISPGTGTQGLVSVASGAILQAGADSTTTGTTLSLLGGLKMLSGSTLEFVVNSDLSHTTLALAAAPTNSQTNAFASALSVTLLGTLAAGTYDNIITGLASDPGTESTWVLTNGGYTATFVYDGAGDIDLTLAAVPEPGTVSLLMFGSAALLFAARKRFRFAA